MVSNGIVGDNASSRLDNQGKLKLSEVHQLRLSKV